MAPELGTVVQGHQGGGITGLKQALIDLHDANSAGLDTAIDAATCDGASVGRTDGEFPDWVAEGDDTY